MSIIRKMLWIVKITIISVIESVLNFLPEGSYGDIVRGFLIKIQVKKCGKKLRVSKSVRILHPKKLSIGDNVYIGYGTWVNAEFEINIGNNTMIGPYVTLASGNHTFTNESKSFYGKSKGSKIQIGSGCWLGAGSVVTSTGSIGDFSLIAANAVITKEIPENCKVVGNNKIISRVFEVETE